MSGSTEVGDNIAFSAAHHQQAFKLLELPPELLALLESENPPILTLHPDPSPTSTGHALLSTPSNSLTYHIRQKNTSNPIHLLSPALTSIPIPIAKTKLGEEDEDEGIGEEGREEVLGICSIAMIEDTLELYAVVKGEGQKEEKGVGGGKVNKWHEKFAKGKGK